MNWYDRLFRTLFLFTLIVMSYSQSSIWSNQHSIYCMPYHGSLVLFDSRSLATSESWKRCSLYSTRQKLVQLFPNLPTFIIVSERMGYVPIQAKNSSHPQPATAVSHFPLFPHELPIFLSISNKTIRSNGSIHKIEWMVKMIPSLQKTIWTTDEELRLVLAEVEIFLPTDRMWLSTVKLPDVFNPSI